MNSNRFRLKMKWYSFTSVLPLVLTNQTNTFFKFVYSIFPILFKHPFLFFSFIYLIVIVAIFLYLKPKKPEMNKHEL